MLKLSLFAFLGLGVAQTSSGDPTTDWTKILIQLGLSAVFLFLYFRMERRADKLQEQLNDKNERDEQRLEWLGQVVAEGTKVMEGVNRALTTQVNRTIGPATEVRSSVETLEGLISELSDLVHQNPNNPLQGRGRGNDPRRR